jgi:hypothetical protein
MPLALGFCIVARRTISNEHVTDFPLPTGPISVRIGESLNINALPVVGGV